MSTQPHDLQLDAELQRLLQRRKLLLLEREIAKKGREARRELDRAERMRSKRKAKALALAAARSEAAATEAGAAAEGSWLSRKLLRPLLACLPGSGKAEPGRD